MEKNQKGGHNSKNNQNFKKMRKVPLNNHLIHMFANFQLFISITVEASFDTTYKGTFQKGP